MELERMIGKFDKWMHEHGHKLLFVLVVFIAVIFFLLWVLATTRMPEANAPVSGQASSAKAHYTNRV